MGVVDLTGEGGKELDSFVRGYAACEVVGKFVDVECVGECVDGWRAECRCEECPAVHSCFLWINCRYGLQMKTINEDEMIGNEQ